MRYLILLLVFASCYGPQCEYQELSSCEIYTNGDRNHITVMAKGQHLCCWYATFDDCLYWTEERIIEEMRQWYQDLVNENPECLLDAENCGPSWAYGEVIN